MPRHFEIKLLELKNILIKMGSLAESALTDAFEAIRHRNRALAGKVINEDAKINDCEIAAERTIVELLALEHPVATDLRYILAALKISNDLERIGDHAVNLAESALILSDLRPTADDLPIIVELYHIARRMLGDALDSMVHLDSEIGYGVLAMDDTADTLNKTIIQQMMDLIRRDPAATEYMLEIIRVSRDLERVADLATNIAEEVVFVAQARVVKHGVASPLSPSPHPHEF